MKRVHIIVPLLFLFAACTGKKSGPDVSGIKAPVVIEQFENAVFSMDTANLENSVQALKAKHPFGADYFNAILGLPPTLTPEAKRGLLQFLTSYRPVYTAVEQKYKKNTDLQAGLEEGFKHVKYYYPAYVLPKVATFLAPFDAPGAVLTKTYLGIGLQQFAGKNFEAYQDPQIQEMYPAYISRRFDKEYIVPAALKAIADDVYPDASAGRPLIEQMIEKGKAWYLLRHFLPEAADSVQWGYTGKQIAWLRENEGNIWSHLLSNENLYTIEPPTVQTYLGDAPFTQGLPESSPGNLGQWVGLRIIQKWADKIENVSLQQVLATPAKKIFDESGYRPK